MIRKELYVYCNGGVCGSCDKFVIHLVNNGGLVEYHCMESNNDTYDIAKHSTIYLGTDFERTSLLGVRVFTETMNDT